MFLGKQVRIFMQSEAQEALGLLTKSKNKESESVLKSFERVKEILRQNPQYGNPIKKELIPSSLKKQGIGNLYRVELSSFWRMLYTVGGNEEGVRVVIIHLFNHDNYNKLFGYKKK